MCKKLCAALIPILPVARVKRQSEISLIIDGRILEAMISEHQMSAPGGLKLQALLGMSQSSCTLTKAKSLGTKVLCITTCELNEC